MSAFSSPGRLIQLDLLRGVAILLVLARHPVADAREAGILTPVAETARTFGWTGVDLFFVLSGFLIGGLLFNEIRRRGRLDVGRFLVRRGFKIWPSYYVYLSFVALQLVRRRPAGQGVGDALRPILPSVLNVQNYFGTVRYHLWSLAVEEHFYLILPPLLLIGLRFRRAGRAQTFVPGVVTGAVAVMLACTAARCLLNAERPYGYATHLTPTHLRIDSLSFGVLLAYLYHREPSPLAFAAGRRAWLLAAGLALVAPMAFLDSEGDLRVSTWGYTLLYLGYGCILLAVVNTPATSWMTSLPTRLVAFIGTFSYPIYLWHGDLALAPVAGLVAKGWLVAVPPTARWVLAMSVYVLVATAAGVVMSLAVERPTLYLRDRYFPPRGRAV
jgi:peptidoglycan/LPS O-acetylase OafA/YrhL